jgi:hypothetical protein
MLVVPCRRSRLIAIERGEGLVVELIAAAGHPVLMVEPAAFKATRPRWGSAGAKSDLGDAFMLADYARTDGHRLRRVEPVDYPTPQSAALLGEGRMRQFCRRHSYRGGKSPAELVARLRAAPAAVDPITASVLTAIVNASVAHIRTLNTQISHLEDDLDRALAAHPKTALLRTLPRVATVSLAALIAEIGPLLDR